MPSKDVLAALNILVPGFMAAWVYFGLTAHPKPSAFERVAQALVFNLIVQPFVFAIKLILTEPDFGWTIGTWNVQSESIAAGIVAFVIGFLFAGLTNNDTLFEWLRKRSLFFGSKKEDDD